MLITQNTVVSLSYRLATMDDELLEEAEVDTPADYLHGGYDGIFPKVEAMLEGKTVGDTLDVVLDPPDAFGEYDADLLRVEPRSDFPAEAEVGMQFEGHTGDGDHLSVFTVTDIADDKVVVDGNHPLAGQRLHITCRVLAVRAAIPEEIAHGHVHGADGHHHDHDDDDDDDDDHDHSTCGHTHH
jgi:FKBP-type peptidyl-prolyl cis-trans isomerase SlyD